MPADLPKKADLAYLQFLDRIHSKRWKVGTRIPGELELAAEFNCSRGTISKALTRLSHEGIVARKTKTGTVVLREGAERAGGNVDLDAVAFIYPSEKHEGIWRTVTGFQKAARDGGERTILLSTGTDDKKEGELIASLQEFNVKGAVIYLMIQTPGEQVYLSQILARSSFPIVLACVNMPGMDFPAVIFDDFHAGYTMTKHLLGQGARRIGFYSSSRAPDGCHGYLWALREAGIAPMPDLVLMEQGLQADFQDPLREPAARARDFLRARPRIEAVVCGYDYLAIGMIEAARSLGLDVPRDLRVTGVDDFSSPCPVPLTTYHVPYEEIGTCAFRVLSERIRTRASSVLEHRLTGDLVVRESA